MTAERAATVEAGTTDTLRDRLAMDRTLLANERTLLAYVRTSLALLLAGATIIHFTASGWYAAVGIACVGAGLVIGTIGAVRFRAMSSALAIVRQKPDRNDGDADNRSSRRAGKPLGTSE